MARTPITAPTIPTTAGTAVTPAAAPVDGIAIPNNGRRALRVTNGGGTSINVTEKFGPAAQVDGVAPADRSVAVAAAATKWFGPWGGEYTQADDGSVHIDFSGVTSVTYEVVEFNAK
ncbi:hypothetical protein ABT340_04705 [Streptosporangium sp. NPDC000239]|uniref:hypothetical protein n=1 Tax=Streptosporangium sp. NPDC000239 TaxID=3154248 RepID=UPI00332741A3